MNRVVACGFTLVLLSVVSFAQLDKISFPAGSPEDQALNVISNEQDAQKKVTMYQDFLQKFSSNPAALAYGNWQLAQTYQALGDLKAAIEYGDKALANSPHNLDILVSQVAIAQQLKDNAKVVDYSVRGGQAYQSIAKQPRPEGMSDQDYAARIEEDRKTGKSSSEFLEAAAFNSIADESAPKARMSYIERFSTAYPDSKFGDQVGQYAMYTLGPGQLNDPARLVAFGEKSLATSPDSIPTLLLLANFYVEDSKPGSSAKAVTYAEKVVTLAKADAPDADRSRKLSAGVAQSTVGYALMKQDKTAASVSHLKAASALLKGQDDGAYATALYRLGYAYAKLSKVTEAREVLTEAAAMPGPAQQPSKELLLKVNAARAKGK